MSFVRNRGVRLKIIVFFGSYFLILFGALPMTVYSQKIIAHRGASHDAPENTLAAFKLAWQQGADGVEGDFYLTRDGEVVCIHDKTTRRTAGENQVVADATLAELQALDVGKWKGDKFAGEKIPTLRQVIATVPEGKWLIIELKAGPEIVPAVRQVLTETGLPKEQICIISFSQQTIAAAKHQLPQIKAHWLTGYEQKGESKAWRPTVKEVAETVQRTGGDGLGTEGNRKVVTSDFLAKLREQGVSEFHVWTVDDPQDAQFFADQGAWGITTNRPLEIRRSLEKTSRK